MFIDIFYSFACKFVKFISKYKRTVCKYLNWLEFQIPAFRAFCMTAFHRCKDCFPWSKTIVSGLFGRCYPRREGHGGTPESRRRVQGIQEGYSRDQADADSLVGKFIEWLIFIQELLTRTSLTDLCHLNVLRCWQIKTNISGGAQYNHEVDAHKSSINT